MGALEAPQDRHGQEHRMGPLERNRQLEAMAEMRALEAMADCLRGPWPRSLSARPLQPELFTPPPKKIPWGS